jgi:hypothetical protein
LVLRVHYVWAVWPQAATSVWTMALAGGLWLASAVWPATGVWLILKGTVLSAVAVGGLVTAGELGARDWQLVRALHRPASGLPKL